MRKDFKKVLDVRRKSKMNKYILLGVLLVLFAVGLFTAFDFANEKVLLHEAVMWYKGDSQVSLSAEIRPWVKIPNSTYVGKRVVINGSEDKPAVIGENVFIGRDVIIWGQVEIGDGTRIDPKVVIQDSTHDSNNISTSEPVHAPVKIGKNVIIDIGAIINKGVVIGDGAVVSAGAVVPSYTIIPANTVVFGNPAKPIELRKYKGKQN